MTMNATMETSMEEMVMEKMRLEKLETAMEKTVTNGWQSSYECQAASGRPRLSDPGRSVSGQH